MKTGFGTHIFQAELPLVLTLAVVPCGAPSFAGPNSAERIAAAEDASAQQPKTYTLADGRIEIKPRLKYELILSIHVLRCAEDHHQLFTNWAQQMRATLSPETLREATNLNAVMHEWQLCSLVQNYDGTDSIEGVTQYLRGDGKRECDEWAVPRRQFLRKLGVAPQEFAGWYADFLERYYREGFGKTWEGGQRQLVQDQAPETVKTMERLPYSILGFMEKHTGRKFHGTSKIIFYPSSFSRPQHAYGFEENGCKVVVYKVSKNPAGAMSTAFHELLHPLLGGWGNAERMKKAVSELGNQAPFKEQTQALRGSYDYPEGCVEEIMVHALGNYLCVKAGVFNEAEARKEGYGPYQSAVYDAIFDRYEQFPIVDDFIFYAITHIHTAESPGQPKWAYKR